jgi:hypothetical protein
MAKINGQSAPHMFPANHFAIKSTFLESEDEISTIIAPELIPMIPGSAKSFRVMLCKIAPETARAIPARTVIIIRGNRIENNTNSSLNVPSPRRVGSSLFS